jgi:hypothetical protein
MDGFFYLQRFFGMPCWSDCFLSQVFSKNQRKKHIAGAMTKNPFVAITELNQEHQHADQD